MPLRVTGGAWPAAKTLLCLARRPLRATQHTRRKDAIGLPTKLSRLSSRHHSHYSNILLTLPTHKDEKRLRWTGWVLGSLYCKICQFMRYTAQHSTQPRFPLYKFLAGKKLKHDNTKVMESHKQDGGDGHVLRLRPSGTPSGDASSTVEWPAQALSTPLPRE